MTHFGSPADWVDLIDSQVPDILALVISSWKSLPAPAANEHENNITNRLCAKMQNAPNREMLPFHIQPQDVILEPDSGIELGRTVCVSKIIEAKSAVPERDRSGDQENSPRRA
jgi:hypothetical protein